MRGVIEPLSRQFVLHGIGHSGGAIPAMQSLRRYHRCPRVYWGSRARSVSRLRHTRPDTKYKEAETAYSVRSMPPRPYRVASNTPAVEEVSGIHDFVTTESFRRHGCMDSACCAPGTPMEVFNLLQEKTFTLNVIAPHPWPPWNP
jgi:hypothetical protein